jgi:hypothetical protein
MLNFNYFRDAESVLVSSQAITSDKHRKHIIEHLEELLQAISTLELTSYQMLCQAMTINDTEAAAEQIDEEIHRVQYKLDHCRRLLQGSETGLGTYVIVSEDQKVEMHGRLKSLKCDLAHLLEHFNTENIDLHAIKEIHSHIDEMEEHLHQFHSR